MTTLQEAFPNGEPNWLPTCDESKKLHEAESAFIRTALEQQGKPVAWLHPATNQAFTNEPPPGLKAKCRPLVFGDAAAPAPQPSDLSHLATIAGLESSIGHLSALFNEQLLLLEEVEEKLGVDGMGNELNDGECVLVDRIREHLAAMAPPTRRAPHSQDLLLNRLLNIADGVRMYGAPDKDLLADRLVAIASGLADRQASQQVQVKPEFQAEVDAMTTAAEVRKAAVTGTLTPNSIYNGLN